VDIKATCIDL